MIDGCNVAGETPSFYKLGDRRWAFSPRGEISSMGREETKKEYFSSRLLYQNDIRAREGTGHGLLELVRFIIIAAGR